MKATITGATGHVGVALARALLERGHEVRALVRRSAEGLDGLAVKRVEGDVTRPETLAAAFDGADVVFHAAGRISISRADADGVAAVNVGGTRNVIAACRTAGVRRLVHFSSIEALDPRPFDAPVDEARPLVDGRGGSPYAATKARAEREVRRAAADGLDAVVLNPTAIIGPFDYRPSLLGSAIAAFARGRLPVLVKGGFDWVDVRDVAAAAVAAAERAPAGGRYIVGGRWASMMDLAALAGELTGRRRTRVRCPFWLAYAGAAVTSGVAELAGGTPLFTPYSLGVLRGNPVMSHAAAERDLGYAPRALEETIRDTCAWFRGRGLLA
jgi:dihydroflavonol-4-reductase